MRSSVCQTNNVGEFSQCGGRSSYDSYCACEGSAAIFEFGSAGECSCHGEDGHRECEGEVEDRSHGVVDVGEVVEFDRSWR